jgi:hypothetical protein
MRCLAPNKDTSLSLISFLSFSGFIAPDYKDTIDQAGQFLVVFEVKFDKAVITLDFDNIETYVLT